MQLVHVASYACLGIYLLLGIVVYCANPRRGANRQFLVLSGAIGSYLVALEMTFRAVNDAEQAGLFIRLSCCTGMGILVAFNLLRLSIMHPKDSCRELVKRSPGWVYAWLGTWIISYSRFFVLGVVLPTEGNNLLVPEPIHAIGYTLVNLVLTGAVVWLVVSFIRDMKRTRGMQRVELQYIMVGSAACVLVALSLAVLSPYVTGSSQSAMFLPFPFLILDAILAYGIAQRRILNVGEFLRQATAYGLIVGYLIIVYAGVWGVLQVVSRQVYSLPVFAAHILAAFVMAFSLAPAHGIMQKFANKLFINIRPLDLRSALAATNQILQSLPPLNELLDHFSAVIGKALGADRVTIVLLDGTHSLEQCYPQPAGAGSLETAAGDYLVERLRADPNPIAADSLQRMRPTKQVQELNEFLSEMATSLAVGIQLKGELEGIMFLGNRLSGRIYSKTDQEAVQLLGNQLAVALENAKLYSEVRRSERLAIMGRIAANMAHEIKNPLVALKTFTQLLPERYDDEEFRRTFTPLIGSEVTRIDGLVDQLLEFARPAAPILTGVHIHELLDNLISLLEPQFQQHRIVIERQFSATYDLVKADAHQIEQAFMNLLLNALEAIDRNGRLSLTTTDCDPGVPGANQGGKAITISVGDSGPGIEEGALKRVFEPFITTKHNGTGLGLAITHRIIKEHHGEIAVESELGRGTTFRIRFPVLDREVVHAC